MTIDNSINLDLHEDRLYDFKERIETDLQAFLKTDLGLFYQIYQQEKGCTEAFENELIALVQLSFTPSINSWAIVDHWTNSFFGTLTITTANKCRDLLFYLFNNFENSAMLEWICERFNRSKSKLLTSVRYIRIYAWFKLWMVHHYPNIAFILLGNKRISTYLKIRDIELKKVIFFLPKFMIWNLSTSLSNPKNLGLFRELAHGKNIRDTKDCPVFFTKKMAHHFTNAPWSYNLNAALWFGIIKGFNGNFVLFKVFKSHFNLEEKQFEFVKKLIVFFVNNKPVEADELKELLGYLQHLKDEKNSFSIKGWTLQSLRRRAAQWRAERNQRRISSLLGISEDQNWAGAPYLPFEAKIEEVEYQIVQLNSVKELFKEGKNLRHCVATYARKCLYQKTSIWSLRAARGRTNKRLVTIEINKDGVIVQAKGKSNSTPKKCHLILIRRWAILEGLKFK